MGSVACIQLERPTPHEERAGFGHLLAALQGMHHWLGHPASKTVLMWRQQAALLRLQGALGSRLGREETGSSQMFRLAPFT